MRLLPWLDVPILLVSQRPVLEPRLWLEPSRLTGVEAPELYPGTWSTAFEVAG